LPAQDQILSLALTIGSEHGAEESAIKGAKEGAGTGAPVSAPSFALVPALSYAPFVGSSSAPSSSFAAYLGLAAAMGGLSLLTPCVFPMVPITVSYFTSRGARSRRGAVRLAIVYGLGIVLTFSAVGFTVAMAFG